MISGLRESLRGTAVPIGNIVSALQNQAGRPVIDKTGLKALFDMTLEFSLETQPALTPPPSPSAAGGGTAVPGGIQANAAEPAPSLFTAVQEQLGLKLESAKGMVEVLVIDSAQKPTEN
jgi:uncharacterized protein (TIGR03435 family)